LGLISHFDAEFCRRAITATVQLGFFALAKAILSPRRASCAPSINAEGAVARETAGCYQRIGHRHPVFAQNSIRAAAASSAFSVGGQLNGPVTDKEIAQSLSVSGTY